MNEELEEATKKLRAACVDFTQGDKGDRRRNDRRVAFGKGDERDHRIIHRRGLSRTDKERRRTMTIDIHLHECLDAYRRVAAVDVAVVITHSPREGYDNDKLGELERDLGPYISKRLNAAIKKGGEA